jgi:hypothetical protein
MSRKIVEETVEELDPEALTPDLGATLKMLGEVLVKKWHSTNGIFLSADERQSRGTVPQAIVEKSDIQIRQGDWLYTIVPCDEDKAMVSIPVGLSDKVTPATIPKDWVIGFLVDAIIELCEGDDYIARYWLNMMNNQINNAMQIDPETGRMKIDQKLLPEVRNPIEVAEMVGSLRRSFKSVSNPSTKTNFTFTATRLEKTVSEPVVEEKHSATERLIAIADEISNSTSKEEQEVGGESMPFTDPVTASVETVHSATVYDSEEVVVVVANPTPPVDEADEGEDVEEAIPTEMEIIEHEFETDVMDEIRIHIESDLEIVEENPHNFKKQPVAWIKHQLAADYFNAEITINDVAELAGCHVQTIKRALEQFEAEAEFSQTIPHEDGDYLYTWTELGFTLNDTHRLLITCERSPTGRYARGRPIRFIIKPKEDLPFDQTDNMKQMVSDLEYESSLTVQSIVDYHNDEEGIPIEALEDMPPVLKDSDSTDPSLSACPDCGVLLRPSDAPQEAPDFVCDNCHALRMIEDEEWYEESNIRAEQLALYDAKPVEGDTPITEFFNAEIPTHVQKTTENPMPSRPVTKGGCDNCDAPVSFKTMTTIGERGFCTEKCWAEYVGEPVKPEGHFGLQAAHDEEKALEDQYDFSQAMGL